MNVSFLDLRVNSTEKALLQNAINRVLDHGQLVMGPEVFEYEELLAAYCNRRFSVAVGSGTTALILALKALRLSPGDEVITSSLSWIATANAIAIVGATPVFADIEADLNISPDSVYKLITPKTKAVISVDFTGKLADWKSLEQICADNNLYLIADSSQSFGAKRSNCISGSYGIMSAMSHNPMKVLGALGEAGSILTDDPQLKESLAMLRYNGTVNKEFLVEPSINGRMDTLQASVLIERLKNFASIQEIRQHNASIYRQELSDVDEIILPCVASDELHSFYTYTIIAGDRDRLQNRLHDQGVEAKIQHPILMCHQPPYRNCMNDCVKGKSLVGKVLSIPIHEKLNRGHIEYVSDCIRAFYR